MRASAALVAAALVSSGLAATAAAAPKRVSCHLVRDPAGDVSNRVEDVAVFPDDPGLDLVGADVVSDAKNVTAVVRLGAPPGGATVYAKRYVVEMDVAGLANTFVLAAAVTPAGTTYEFGYRTRTVLGSEINYSATPAVGRFDGKRLVVATTLENVAKMPELGTIRKGAKISSITVTANRRVPPVAQGRGQMFVADEAFGRALYYAGSPSCVKPFAG